MYKGGDKNRKDPSSYRAISLCSTVLKLYKKVLLDLTEQSKCKSFSPLQCGFQKNVSCLMSAFMVRECINYARDNKSYLCSCYPDVKMAFGYVPHSFLLLKLYKTGMDLKLFNIYWNLLENARSSVKTHGITSQLFNILQGARQGQVSSAFMYSLFINSLLESLDRVESGLNINNTSCSCPTSADDMVLRSLTKHGLDELMQCCFKSSQLERYLYKTSKCKVVVYNETPIRYKSLSRIWHLGQEVVSEATTYVDLGVLSDKYGDLNEATNLACSNMRKTFFSLVESGLHRGCIHPLTSRKIYVSIILPKALYGCELWNNITASQTVSLERAHRHCIKHMKAMPQCTRSDIALSYIGIHPI
jgi:hypothetical protein